MRLLMLAPLAVSLAMLPACSKRPPEVLDEDEMSDLLADMQIAESYSVVTAGGNNSLNAREELGLRVLAAHNVTQARLDSSMAWYGRNLDTYSKLYEKVDKKLDAKRRKYVGNGNAEEDMKDNMWPYHYFAMISPLATSDGFSFAITPEAMEKGDRVEWKMHLSPASSCVITLGVMYSDGMLGYVSRTFNNDMSPKITLQTDSSRTVGEIYGYMRMTPPPTTPVMADSLRLTRLPLDSALYYSFFSQKKYRDPGLSRPDAKKKPHAAATTEKKDSVAPDHGESR